MKKKGLARSRNRRELHEIFIKRGEIKKGFSPDVPARYLTLRTGINTELQPSHKLNGLSFETEEYRNYLYRNYLYVKRGLRPA